MGPDSAGNTTVSSDLGWVSLVHEGQTSVHVTIDDGILGRKWMLGGFFSTG